MEFVDLHLHTHHSDGSDSPETVVHRALAAGASAIAITDHDTVSGVESARTAAAAEGLGFLAGTEISTFYRGREIHVLGLGVDDRDQALIEALEALCAGRRRRSADIVARLQSIGIVLPGDAVDVEGGAVGRMHIARELTRAGMVKKPQEAFDRYLNPGKPAYVPKWSMPIVEAVERIHGAGGLAFVAHPGLGKTVKKLLPELLTSIPFDGIEAYHVSHSPGRIEEYVELARERGLMICGGSDCHGTIKGKALLGTVRTPRWVYERIAARLAAN